MPGPKTHDIFYKDLKKKLSDETLASFPNYDDYNVFAQGHDFLIYHDFYKIWNQERLNQNVQNSVLLQEHSFSEFIYHYLNTAMESGAIEDEQTRLFIGPGYIMHHLLDAYTHPQIIYYSGDHVRDPKNRTWKHGIVENLIDIYLMEEKEGKNPRMYPVYKDFEFLCDTSEALIQTLDSSLFDIYHIQNGGEIFQKSFYQMESFMKLMKYDPSGFKQKIFDLFDPVLKGTSSFSYHRDSKEVFPYLNLEDEEWQNPVNGEVSRESFLELYDRALCDGSYIIDELEKMCQRGTIYKDDIYSLIPNISSVHGLECEIPMKIKYKKNEQ